jgi:hypothetical protein
MYERLSYLILDAGQGDQGRMTLEVAFDMETVLTLLIVAVAAPNA